MSSLSDPKRSFEDPGVPAGLRTALLAARADRPSAESLSRVASRLGVASSPASGVPALASSAGRIKLIAIAALCVVGGASLHAVLTSPRKEAVAVTAAPELKPVEAEGLAPAPAVASVQIVDEPIAPVAESRTIVRAKRSPAAKPRAGLAESDSADPNAELELLRRAQAALTPAPSRALALCEEHARQFPRGSFQQERELIAVVALANRGELEAAQTRAARFKRAFPDSVHEPRLEALLRDHKRGELGARRGEPAESRPSTGE